MFSWFFRKRDKRVFNHTAFKELWEWLAKTGALSKRKWPGWDINGGKYKECAALCFACEYSKATDCSDCPLYIPTKQIIIDTECLGGLYSKWRNARNTIMKLDNSGKPLPKREQKIYNRAVRVLKATAQQIAKLPVKEGIKTI